MVKKWVETAFLLFTLLCAGQTAAAEQEINGSGSTFVYPALMKWTDTFRKSAGIAVHYQPIGSSAGLTEIRGDVVDFGVSDAPLNGAQLLRDGLAQFPVAIGAIVPVINVTGIAPGQLHLNGAVLAAIYLGKIKIWNDPAIVALNPDVTLPRQAILVIHRSDGSGITYNMTDYLAKVSPDWKVQVGADTIVRWPVGYGVKGNGGVADAVAHSRGAIGYVEYSYAMRKELVYALVQNRAGNFVQPGAESFQAAVDGVDWTQDRDFNISLTDAASANAYPIMAASFALIRKYSTDPARTKEVLSFFRWVLASGQKQVLSEGYLPLPTPLAQLIENYLQREVH